MGALTAFNVAGFVQQYGLKNYVETGTGEGVSLGVAANAGFESLHSIDIDVDLIMAATGRFSENVKLHAGRSKDILPLILNELDSSPTMFFLDAHFPGADFHKISYEESIRTYEKDAFPLEDEMNIILSNRDCSNDVFIIDDFILYEDGDYDTIREGVVWRYRWLQEELGLETDSFFLYDLLGATHDLMKDTRHQGYLVAIPKGK